LAAPQIAYKLIGIEYACLYRIFDLDIRVKNSQL